MNVLVVDIGGTNVKILASGQAEPRKFPSGPEMTPQQMVAGVKQPAGEWKYEATGDETAGQRKWTRHVAYSVARLIEAFHPDGNTSVSGGFRLWDGHHASTRRDALIIKRKRKEQPA